MDFGSREALTLCIGSLAFTIVYWMIQKQKYLVPLPPGPKKKPILGNTLDIPAEFEYEAYARWGREFDSDIIHLSVAGADMIVLNSVQAAMELLDRRSSNYSSRSPFMVLNDLMGWGWLMSAMPYGDAWRERRRLFQQYFHQNDQSTYQPTQIEFVRKMLLQLIGHPEEQSTIVRHAIGGFALSIAYGLPIQSKNDPYVNMAEKAVQTIIEGTTPAALVIEMVPILRYLPGWFPGAGFQRRLPGNRRLQEDFRNLPFEACAKGLEDGTVRPSFSTKYLSSLDKMSRDASQQRDVIKDTAGIVFAAGADTTLAAIETFFLAMIHHPEVQVKAQAELDRVLGPGPSRMPEFTDAPRLPYIEALVREVLRWQPPTPIGVPHHATEEDIFNGYRVPKASMVIANSWAMLHDESIWIEPHKFNPERFLKEGRINAEILDPAAVVFGFGRRICPGRHIALAGIWLVAATVLSTLTVSKPCDKHGNSYDEEINMSLGSYVIPNCSNA